MGLLGLLYAMLCAAFNSSGSLSFFSWRLHLSIWPHLSSCSPLLDTEGFSDTFPILSFPSDEDLNPRDLWRVTLKCLCLGETNRHFVRLMAWDRSLEEGDFPLTNNQTNTIKQIERCLRDRKTFLIQGPRKFICGSLKITSNESCRACVLGSLFLDSSTSWHT